MKFDEENPRFVWNIGSIGEFYKDMPEQGATVDLIDRKHGKVVVSIAEGYGNLVCLETVSHGQPFTELENWLNSLRDECLKSEGIE